MNRDEINSNVVVLGEACLKRISAIESALENSDGYEGVSKAGSLEELQALFGGGNNIGIIITEVGAEDPLDGVDEIKTSCQRVASVVPFVVVFSNGRSSDERASLSKAKGARIIRIDGNEIAEMKKIVELKLQELKEQGQAHSPELEYS